MDVTKEAISKTLFIELELVMDIYSLVFCNIRFHLERKYHLEINNKEVTALYGKTLYEGIKDVLTPKLAELKIDEEINIDEQVQEILDGFRSNSASLKPTVPSIHVIQQLKKDRDVSVVLFTYLEMDTVNAILDPAFVKQVDEIKSVHDVSGKADQFSADFNMIIFG